MSFHNLSVGKLGEKIASEYLQKKGFQMVEKNFYCHWGEIDIVAKELDKLHFVEIKTRIGIRMGKPYESVTKPKVKKLMRTIQFYLLNKKLKNYKLSLDVISIVLDSQGFVDRLDYFENITS